MVDFNILEKYSMRHSYMSLREFSMVENEHATGDIMQKFLVPLSNFHITVLLVFMTPLPVASGNHI